MKRRLKILVACEYSGTVREAFSQLGHDAMSCDLLPTEKQGKHYVGNVLDILKEGWDLMIGHPPCTYLSYAAKKYWNTPGRAHKRLEALSFFLTLWEAPIPFICLENPLGCADAVIEKHTQIIEPYYFGDPHKKRTCIWLKNLPKLRYTHSQTLFEKASAAEKPQPIYTDKSGKKRYFTDATGGYHGEGASFKKRSVTFPGIAAAMAAQWSDFILNKTEPTNQ
jgi:hypothetical protein